MYRIINSIIKVELKYSNTAQSPKMNKTKNKSHIREVPVKERTIIMSYISVRTKAKCHNTP